MVSATYMVGLVAEDTLACSISSATKQALVSQVRKFSPSLFKYAFKGNDDIICSALAVVHYFFSSAGTLWWLILSFSWFLVTTLKWGEAPVGQVFADNIHNFRLFLKVFSSYFNMFAWLLPLIGTFTLVAVGGIDGDVFTGICSLGNLRSEWFLHLVVVPQAIAIGSLSIF